MVEIKTTELRSFYGAKKDENPGDFFFCVGESLEIIFSNRFLFIEGEHGFGSETENPSRALGSVWRPRSTKHFRPITFEGPGSERAPQPISARGNRERDKYSRNPTRPTTPSKQAPNFDQSACA